MNEEIIKAIPSNRLQFFSSYDVLQQLWDLEV